MKKNRRLLFPLPALLLFFVLVGGCSPEGEAESTLEYLKFNVTDSLLARPVTDPSLGITYRPPRGWTPLDQHLIDSAQKVAALQTGASIARFESVRNAFADEANNSIFVVMKVDSFDVSDSSASVKDFVRQLQASDSSLDIRTALFRVGDFRVHQVLVLSSATVSLWMIFDNLLHRAPIFAFNFVAPRDSYQLRAKEIESVVGSLQPASSIH